MMIKLKIGFGLAGFFTIPIEKAIETVARIGYDGIEIYVWKDYIFDASVLNPTQLSKDTIQHSLDQILESTRRFNIDISSLLSLDIEFGYRNPTEKNRLKHIEFTKECIDMADKVGTRIVNMTSGQQLKGYSRTQSWEKLIDTVGKCVDYASGKNIQIAFEPHAPFRGNNMIVDSLETLLELLKEIQSKNLQVNFDPSHFSIRGWDVPKSIRKLSKHIVHTHLKGSRGSLPKYQWYIPGEHSEDQESIKEFVLALKEIGYDGFISVEIANSRRTEILYDPNHASKLAYKTISSILNQSVNRS